MLYSNIGATNSRVLAQAEKAATLYRSVGDSRGLARALSQVSAREASQSRYDEARAAAEEALELARDTGDRRLLADTLRRCASAFAREGADRVRGLYAESAALFRTLDRADETGRALEWWGQWEADVGNHSGAIERFLEAKTLNVSEISMMYLANNIAACFLAIGDAPKSEPYVREALTLAVKNRHPVLTAMAISYIALIAGARDPAQAARLAGYAEERLGAAEWQRVAFERALFDRFYDSLSHTLGEAELARLLREGSAWSDEQAVTQALSH